MEKALYKQIYPVLSCHIPNEEFGFLPGRHTTLRLLRLTECYWQVQREGIYSGHIPRCVQSIQQDSYANYTQLECRIPLPFLSYRTVPYLTERTFTVEMEGQFSEWKSLRAGVPQGLSRPLCCTIYVADIPKRPGIEILKFADDIAAFTPNKNINYAVSNLQILKNGHTNKN
jgi:hypothetical protein